MLRSRRHVVTLALAAACVALGACQEDLQGGAACPITCPEQSLEVRDTVIFPVALDTTLVGYPPLGSEPGLLLAHRGDTLQTAAVVRFDTLPDRVTRITDTAAQHLVSIDTASLLISVADTATRPAAVTFEVYDVDVDAPDLDTAAVRALFRGDRLVASRTVPRDSVRGTVAVALPTSFLLPRILNAGRVRLGVTIRSEESVQFVVGATETGAAVRLQYLARAATDTQTLTVPPISKPGTQPTPVFADLEDYQLVLRAPTPVRDPAVLAVGGVPGSRAYLRFDLPAGIVESTTVVRATLRLTQRPNRSVAPADSVTVLPRLVRATSILDAEPGKAALVLADPRVLSTLRILPADSGVRALEIPNALQVWRRDDPSRVPPALVLQSAGEGIEPQSVYFFSSDAAEELRPQLRLRYIPRAGFGLP